MKKEIERRFLVTGRGWEEAPAVFMSQGYLASEEGCTVPVRIAGEKAWLTIKGLTQGISRDEFEYPVPVDDAQKLMTMARYGRVEKWRRAIDVDGLLWEVDEFTGENAGLVMAEIELSREDQAFALPEWLGREVTHESRYVNAALAMNPYVNWRTAEPGE